MTCTLCVCTYSEMYLQLDILEIRELGVSMGGCIQTCEVQIDNMVLKNLV